MPAFFDSAQMAKALNNDVLPALQHFADHPNYRKRVLGRFESDELPPYETSTEEEFFDESPLTADELDAMRRRFNAPLTDKERSEVMYSAREFCEPLSRFREEEAVLRDEVHDWARHHDNKSIQELLSPRGSGAKIHRGVRRCAIVARHLIKRRWQKLGVWNPAWGIPEPEMYPSEPSPSRNYAIDRWLWNHGDQLDASELYMEKPVQRAMDLRQGLHHNEHAPVQPQSHLTPESTVSQAEAFITSRPWFQIIIERCEFSQRSYRLNRREDLQLKSIPSILSAWKARGDWQDSWDGYRRGGFVGWKWRHESPSPEPEDLSNIQTMADLELTPSEVDALDGIVEPPPPPPPPYVPPTTVSLFWTGPLPSPVPPTKPRTTRARSRRAQAPRRLTQRVTKAKAARQPLRRSARIAAMVTKQAAEQPTKPAGATQRATRSARPRRARGGV